MLLSGRAAGEVALGQPSQGAGGTAYSDLGKATLIVSAMFTSVGLGDTLLFRAPAETAMNLMTVDRVLETKVHKVMAELYERALELMREHLPKLEAIANELVERRFLTGAEVESIIRKTDSLPPPS